MFVYMYEYAYACVDDDRPCTVAYNENIDPPPTSRHQYYTTDGWASYASSSATAGSEPI